MTQNYSIMTPEGITIQFRYIHGNELKELLKNNNKELTNDGHPVIDILGRRAVLFPDGKVVQVVSPGSGQALIFNNKNDYVKANRSNEYFATTIIIDSNDVLHYSFSLENALSYYKKAIKKLDQFPEYEGYCAYLLPQGRVCFVREIAENRYQGYWYPDMANFEYFYKIGTDSGCRGNKN